MLPGHSGATRPGATAATTRSPRVRLGDHNKMLGYRERRDTERNKSSSEPLDMVASCVLSLVKIQNSKLNQLF